MEESDGETTNPKRQLHTIQSLTLAAATVTTSMSTGMQPLEVYATCPSVEAEPAGATQQTTPEPEAVAPAAEPRPIGKGIHTVMSKAFWVIILPYTLVVASLLMIRDVILYAWHGVFGRKKKDDESQSPVRIILRREKPRRRARPRQPKPSQATQSTRRKPMPEMLKKLAPTAKAVTSFASRTTTNLRKTPAVRMQLDTSVLRRRLSLSTQRIRIPDVIGRRRPAPDVYTPSSGSSSSSSSSTSASSASHRFFKFSSLNSGRESSLRSLPSLPSATPEQTTPEAPLPARKPEYTTRLVGATLVRSSPDGCYQLIRTGIVEVPEEEERASSDDGYTSSEGSLSADSESIGSAGSSMDAGADAEVHGQTTAHSGPLGTFRRKLERTVTVLPKPQLIVG